MNTKYVPLVVTQNVKIKIRMNSLLPTRVPKMRTREKNYAHTPADTDTPQVCTHTPTDTDTPRVCVPRCAHTHPPVDKDIPQVCKNRHDPADIPKVCTHTPL